jgi:hypothetical protein
LDVVLARLSNGEGMELLAPAWFAVKPSLLPSRTFHEGPPDCKIVHICLNIKGHHAPNNYLIVNNLKKKKRMNEISKKKYEI